MGLQPRQGKIQIPDLPVVPQGLIQYRLQRKAGIPVPEAMADIPVGTDVRLSSAFSCQIVNRCGGIQLKLKKLTGVRFQIFLKVQPGIVPADPGPFLGRGC